MRLFVVVFLVCVVTVGSFGQEPRPVCPRHIDVPAYPLIARAAHVAGKIELLVMVDTEGRVEKAQPVNANLSSLPADRPYPQLFESPAIENIRRWTFEPRSEPFSFRIVYDYGFDCSGPSSDTAVTKVTIDFPKLVTIRTNCLPLNP